MKIILLSLLVYFVSMATAQEQITTVDEYNELLPVWGTSWAPGKGSINGYYPSFYTGFVARSEYPERIHIRTSRGNQTRVSVILDEKTITDYLYDLEKRYEFYKQVTQGPGGQKAAVDTAPKNSKLVPHLEYFYSIIDSPVYEIRDILAQSSSVSAENFYESSLSVLTQLNPSRIFMINLDLNNEFSQWKDRVLNLVGESSPEAVFTKNAEATVIALNSLVWGRVNYTAQPTDEILATLHKAVASAQSNKITEMNVQATQLFKLTTGNKYDFKVVGVNGSWRKALSCTESGCNLSYPEFTAVYPTGSLKSSTKDKFGNSIPVFATPGLWPFIDRSYHDVDHIRKESYYGWAPKMDFEGIGNGFHNPAVRFAGSRFPKSVKKALGTAMDHTTLWTVMRGGVSHGCLRLPLGHVWEMRHLMPVENDKMKQLYQFGSNSTDFDLYDIDGDGDLEVMGVEYQISYNLQGASGLDKREGADLNIGKDDKLNFYNDLYGSKGVFTSNSEGFSFENPTVSFPSHLDLKKKKTKTQYTVEGGFALYEQTYEKDKVQFYLPKVTSGLNSGSKTPLSKRLVRILGRVRGCAPSSDTDECGSGAFEVEKAKIMKELYND